MSSDGSARVLGGISGGSAPLGCARRGRTADITVQHRYTAPVIDSINRESRGFVAGPGPRGRGQRDDFRVA
jgi:hypothetical protein